MRLSLRFILPLAFTLALLAYAVMPFVDRIAHRWFARDLDMRTRLVAASVQDSLQAEGRKPSRKVVQRVFDRVILDERIAGLAFCDTEARLVYGTPDFPPSIPCSKEAIPASKNETVRIRSRTFRAGFEPLLDSGTFFGTLIVVHDTGFIEKRTQATRSYVFYLFLAVGAVVSLLTVGIAQLSFKGWMKGLRSILKGEGLIRTLARGAPNVSPELKPVMKDLRGLIRDLQAERRYRDESQLNWSPKTLKEILKHDLAGDEVLIVSNREPYIHVRKEDRVEVQFPASGVVTALEPIMRACSGTWIAHGSGSADRESVDHRDHVAVPPDEPSYSLRRVWLTPEEEAGYYYGFANEGLWALCHIAHVRPVFRSSDWAQYVAVNRKFADAVVEEAKTDDPVVLVQDYHFALLPKMIKKRLPKATVITFWHIPFPNPEVFGICPWRQEILEGLLGSNILGFHTRFHCNNFLDTVDRFLETRIDRETTRVSFQGRLTAVNHYPISIEHPVKWLKSQKPVAECRASIRKRDGMPEDRLIGLGVDRLDYTKGILERFSAVERLLELEPQWIGRFSFVQIAAPSRSQIDQYKYFNADVRGLAEKINRRFGREGYQPILLKIEHHEPKQVYEYYRGSDLCFVSSLHDGMNLVAKEFLASRDDERGVLILSQFTGASRELPEALIVNPYNIDQCAAALHMALEMPESEQRSRMRSMRGLIQEYNVYRWAGRMLIDAARLRERSRFFNSVRENAQAIARKFEV